MALNAKIGADYSDFTAALDQVEAKTRGFSTTIGAMSRDVGRMIDSFNGTKILAEAEKMAAALAQTGGASQLTASEMARVNSVMSEAIAKYDALGKAAPESIRQIHAETTRVQPATESWAESIGKMAAGYVAGMMTMDAVKRVWGELTAFVREGIAAAGEAEAAQTRLGSALTNSKQPVAEVSAAFNVFAAHMQATIAIEGTAVVSVMALATEMGVLAGDMGPLITVSANLATAWKVSLEDAMSTVVKGGEGMTKAFKAHGIALDEDRAKAEGLAYVLPELSKWFGTNAQDQLNTYTGRVTALGVAWGALKEAAGGVVASSGLVGAVMADTTLALRGVASIIEDKNLNAFQKLSLLVGLSTTDLAKLGAELVADQSKLRATGDVVLDAGVGFQKTNKVLEEMTATTHKLALAWGQDLVSAANRMAETINASIRTQLETFKDFQQQNELMQLDGTDRKLRQIDIEQAAVMAAAGTEHGVHSELYRMMAAEVQEYYDGKRAAVEGSATEILAALQAEKDANAAASDAIIAKAAEVSTSFRAVAESAREAATAAALLAQGSTFQYDLTTNYGRAQIEQMNPGITEFLRLGYSVQQAMQLLMGRRYNFQANVGAPDLPPWPPGLAGGVTNFSGGLAMVGERGPELLNLPRGSDVIPLQNPKALGGISIVNHISVTQPLGTPDVLARVVGDAMLSRLRALGVRLPSGA